MSKDKGRGPKEAGPRAERLGGRGQMRAGRKAKERARPRALGLLGGEAVGRTVKLGRELR